MSADTTLTRDGFQSSDKSCRPQSLLTEAKRERLFGKIIFEFNDGDIKLVRKELTYKIHHSEEDHSNVTTARRQHDQ